MTRILRKKALLLLLPLAALFVLEMSTLFIIPETTAPETISLSAQLEKGPAIDTEAIMVKSIGDSTEAVSLCQSLPVGIWKLLIIVYVLLLVFNFREQYRTRGAVTTYIFEACLTAFFLIEWLFFDACRTEIWFPLMLIKAGLILFLFFQLKNLITKHKD